MPGLVPGIHVLLLVFKDLDGRDKPGLLQRHRSAGISGGRSRDPPRSGCGLDRLAPVRPDQDMQTIGCVATLLDGIEPKIIRRCQITSKRTLHESANSCRPFDPHYCYGVPALWDRLLALPTLRKPRDSDAELKALGDKAKELKTRMVQQIGELVIATGADAFGVEELAGALIMLVETKDAAKREVWTKRGAAFFQSRARRSAKESDRDAGGPQTQPGGAQPASRGSGAA